MGQTPFSYVKWSLDCVTEQGDAVVLYCAELRWGRIQLVYSNILAVNGQQVAGTSTLARFSLSSRRDQVCVEIPRLEISGRWESLAAPFERTLYKNSDGSAIWDCVQPKSFVHVRAMGKEYVGLGYVERLTMTLPPWALPMCQLGRGHFVSAKDSLVWFDWQGEFSSRFALFNGVVCDPLSVSTAEIVLPAATLNMKEGLTLRTGSIGESILPGAPTIGKLLPAKIFAVKQHFSRNEGVLTDPFHSSAGWAFQEELDFSA